MTMTTTNGNNRQREIDEAVQRAIGPEIYQPNDKPATDVAPTEAAVAQEHAHMLVTAISTNGLSEMRQLRDELDDLMKNLGDRRDLVIEAIQAHAQFVDAAVAHKRVISDHVAKMRAEFDRSCTPLPPAPQLNGRRR